MAEQPRNPKKKGRSSGEKPSRTILRRTLLLMTVCGVLAFVVLAVKLYQIQIVKHDELEREAVEQQLRESTVTAARGTIYDTNGKALAISATVDSVFISPYETDKYGENQELIATNLAEILDVDRESILEKMKDTKSQYKTIKRKIEKEQADAVREFIKANKLKSVHVQPDTKRYYPYSNLACQVLGFVGIDNTGLEGLEMQYNSYLEGTNGRIVRLTNAKGTDMLLTDFEAYYDAKNGDDVTLTIDYTIQFYVEKYLAQAIKDYDVQNGGTCIVMNPKTGAILAMASMNNYDLNNYQAVSPEVQAKLDLITDPVEKKNALSAALLQQRRNKALVDTYEPGSVFKIITCAMALEENIINLDSTFYCGGSMDVLGRPKPLNCWKKPGHGSQTLVQAMQHSCNVALVSIGLDVGAETYYKYVDAFGLKDRTGIDLPGEAGSQWWSSKVFMDPTNLSQLAAASFGQTFNISPLQLLTAVSAVVNGGNLMKPYIVQEITDADGKVVLANEPTAVRQVISAQTSKTMCDILEQVVGGKEGTGKNAAVPGYKIGGKTGTSVNTVIEAETGEKQYIVSFCGIAPMDDPQVAILFLLDGPTNKSGVYVSGGNMAAPVVGRILSEVLQYLDIQPVYTEEEKKGLDITVPKLAGKDIDSASELLENMGLTVKVVGSGETVTDQLPAPNAAVTPGSRIIIYAGAPRPTDLVTVPQLYGKTFREAQRALESLGLFLKSGGTLAESPDAVVSTQSIPNSDQIPAGSVIEVTLVDSSIIGDY